MFFDFSSVSYLRIMLDGLSQNVPTTTTFITLKMINQMLMGVKKKYHVVISQGHGHCRFSHICLLWGEAVWIYNCLLEKSIMHSCFSLLDNFFIKYQLDYHGIKQEWLSWLYMMLVVCFYHYKTWRQIVCQPTYMSIYLYHNISNIIYWYLLWVTNLRFLCCRWERCRKNRGI